MIRYDHYTDKFVKVSDRECPWCKAVCASTDKYCHECGWHIADAPQTETQIETQNSNLTFEKAVEPQTERSACDTCLWYNSGIPCGVEPSVCKREIEDEPQTDCPWK